MYLYGKFGITLDVNIFAKLTPPPRPHTSLRNAVMLGPIYRAYGHDVMAAILLFHNNETAAMLVYQTNSMRVQLFSYVNSFFHSKEFVWLLDT